jgi:hypothetical protein
MLRQISSFIDTQVIVKHRKMLVVTDIGTDGGEEETAAF